MKQSNILKTLSLLITVIAMSLAFASCSSEKDEPSSSGDSEFPIPTIPYTELSGSWLIESITESETGKTHLINEKITIGSFSPQPPKDEGSPLLDYQIWSHDYDDLVSHNFGTDFYTEDLTITYYKYKNSSLSTSQVGGILFSLAYNEDNEPKVQTFIMNGLTLVNGILKSSIGAYASSDNLLVPISGEISMRKL